MTAKSQRNDRSLQFNLFVVATQPKPTRITHAPLTTPLVAGRPVARYRIDNSGNK